jgi:formate dehydrogenase maturation protein FdhE
VDLELSIQDGEPALAIEFFNMVKGWVGELKGLVKATQEANQASMAQIQSIVESSTSGLETMVERMRTVGIYESPRKAVQVSYSTLSSNYN